MRDPLVLGSSAFETQEHCDDLVPNVSDARRRRTVFVERGADGRLVAREE